MDRTTMRTAFGLGAVTMLVVLAVALSAPSEVGAGASRPTSPGRVVALTVDDGPSGTYTPKVLEALQRYGAHATFFVVGRAAAAEPYLVRAELEQGSEVGVHTWSHPMMSRLTPAQTQSEIASGTAVVRRITGLAPRFFRPPHGQRTKAGDEAAAREGLRVVLWDECLDHWADKTPQAAADRVLGQVRPGDVILMHDGLGHRERTVAALGILLSELYRRGYRVVTLSQLYGLAR